MGQTALTTTAAILCSQVPLRHHIFSRRLLITALMFEVTLGFIVFYTDSLKVLLFDD